MSRPVISWLVVGACACAAASSPLAAQSAAPPGPRSPEPDALRFTRVPDEAGLSHQTVHAILQDRDGYLWVGTADGLNRFDGYSFRVYRPGDAGGSPAESLIWDLLEDRDGTLWVATGAGVHRYDRVADRFLKTPGPFDTAEMEVYASSLFEDRRGSLWVATPGGVLKLEEGAFRAEIVPGVRPGEVVVHLHEDRDGRLWFLLADGVLVSGSTGDRVEAAGTPPPLRFAMDSRGRWVRNVADFASSPQELGSAWDGGGFPGIWALSPRLDGGFWIGTESGLVGLDATGELGPLVRLQDAEDNGFVANFVRSVIEDRAGTVWVGTHGGLFRHDPNAKPFVHLAGDPGNPLRLSSSAVSAVWSDEETWVGTLGAGLNRIGPDGAIERFRHDPADPGSIPDDVIWSIHRDLRGRLWIGTANGLASTSTGDPPFRRHPFPEPTQVMSLDESRDGTLWALGTHALFRVEPESGTVGTVPCCQPDGRRSPRLQGLVVDRNDVVWVGAGSSMLIRYDPASGEARSIALDAGTDRPVGGIAIWDIVESRGGVLFLGLGTGLGRFDPRSGEFRLLTPRDGLPGRVVYTIEEDADGLLWLGTNQGLSRLDPSALDRRLRTFGPSDGVGSVEFNRRASFAATDGELFFGGMGGLTRFRPALLKDNPVRPPVVLTSIETSGPDGTRPHGEPPDGVLRLAPRENTVSFEFSALSYTNPSRNRYRYRLQGIDADWVEAGGRRFARYAGLGPGRYVFTVLGSNEDGVWNEVGRSLTVEVPPPFWGTWWFRVLALALLGALVVAAYRARVAHLLAIDRLRVRIAGDLHDDLASDLSGIAVIGETLQRSVPAGSQEHDRIDGLTRTARRLVGDVRDIVWAVDPGHDQLADMTHHLREVAERMLGGLTHSFEVEGSVATGRALPMEARRQILLLFKEALHNAARHAQADAVTISVAWDAESIRLSVRDDGVGFAYDALPHRFGLEGMRRRALEIGGRLAVVSEPGRGTLIELEVPIP